MNRKRWVLGAAVLLVATVGVFGGITVMAQTSWARTQVRERLEVIVSDRIPGSLSVGALRDIKWLGASVRASAHDVRFTDPDGVDVIQVEDAVVVFSLGALLRGTVGITRADAVGGLVNLDGGPGGRTRLENTFDDPDRTIGADAMNIELRELRVRELRLVVHPQPEQVVQVDEIEGVLEVLRLGDAKGVTLQLKDFSGVVTQPTPLGYRAKLTEVSGAVRGLQDEVVALAFKAQIGKGHLAGTLRLLPALEKSIEVRVETESAALELAAAVAELRTHAGNVDLRVNTK